MPDCNPSALIIGITGGIACGKSEVGRILEETGFKVCDADRVAHELMSRGTPVFRQVVDQFGANILSEEGEISRAILGKIIFEHPDQRELLNGLVHPAVRNELDEWIAEKRNSGQKGAVLLPLLFESGMQDLDWDAVLCVSSGLSEVFQRLEKRGLSHAEAGQRIHSQMPLSRKEELADYVIPNIGTLGDLENATRSVVRLIGG